MIFLILLNLHDHKQVLEQQGYDFLVEVLEFVPNLTHNNIVFPTFENSKTVTFRSQFKNFCTKFKIQVQRKDFDVVVLIEGTEIGHYKVLELVWRYDDKEVFVEAKLSVESLFDGTEGEQNEEI